MPSKSNAQARLMAAVAHGWKKPGGGPSRAVAEEFVAGDKAKAVARYLRKKHREPDADERGGPSDYDEDDMGRRG